MAHNIIKSRAPIVAVTPYSGSTQIDYAAAASIYARPMSLIGLADIL
jgi:hypothetical protein